MTRSHWLSRLGRNADLVLICTAPHYKNWRPLLKSDPVAHVALALGSLNSSKDVQRELPTTFRILS